MIARAFFLWFLFQGQSLTPQEIESLIAKLGSDRAEERQSAEDSLVRLGVAVVPTLEKLNHDRDPEIRARVRNIIQQIQPPFIVVASVSDLADLASEIGGDQVSVSVLAKSG